MVIKMENDFDGSTPTCEKPKKSFSCASHKTKAPENRCLFHFCLLQRKSCRYPTDIGSGSDCPKLNRFLPRNGLKVIFDDSKIQFRIKSFSARGFYRSVR